MWEGQKAWTICWHTHLGLWETHYILGKRLRSVPFLLQLSFEHCLHLGYLSSNSHHPFYSTFNQFHFSPSTSKCSSSCQVAMATTVARQHTTLHHPFQKSDRWISRMPKQEWGRKGRETGNIRKKWRRNIQRIKPGEELCCKDVEVMQWLSDHFFIWILSLD